MYQGQNYFGEINNGLMSLNTIGKIANNYWVEIPQHFANVHLDTFVILPNHIHGIIIIHRRDVAMQRPYQPRRGLLKL